MKRLTALVLVLAAAPLVAEPDTRVVRRSGVVKKSTSATTYSAELPVATRVVGTAFFRTSVDITNNTTSNGVIAEYQYAYVRTTDGAFFRTVVDAIELDALANFHTDDLVEFLGQQGLLQPGAAESSFGTFIVTFENLPSSEGWEATVTARTYSPAEVGSGTNSIAYYGSLFFESANQFLVGTIRDTTLVTPTPAAGALRTNIGIRNTDINGTGQNVSADLSFYDPVTGNQVGSVIGIDNLQPGMVRQVNNVFVAAAIPSNITSLICFADVRNPTSTSPTIEGYIVILDDDTKDGAFFEMKCGDSDDCAN